jgi:uncharacterized delta-60 repeat protein/uncharacterized repeat protein (TIGR01451 family)
MIMVMLLMAALPRQARAADGDLDTSFSFDGKLTTSFSGHGDAAHAVAIDASGRIVVAGQTSDGIHQGFGVARYNDDGTLDASFGTNGLVAITPTGFSEGANAVVFDGQGRIVLAGFVTDGMGGSDFVVVRLNGDGALDTTFGGSGIVVTDFGGQDTAHGVAIDSAGGILVGGESLAGLDRMALARYLDDGTLDDAFDGDNNGNGKVTFDFNGQRAGAFAMALDASGRIILAGGASSQFAVARCHPDGTLDHDFNGNGQVTTAIGLISDAANAVTVDANGRIVAAGRSAYQVVSDLGQEFAVVRYNPDGTLDTSFNGDGKVTNPFVMRDIASGVAVDSVGRVVVTGTAGDPAHNNFHDKFVVARYLDDGSKDLDFNMGAVEFDFNDEASTSQAIAIDGSGRIVVAGNAQGNFGVARLIGSEAPFCALTCPASFDAPADPGTCGAAAVSYPAPTTNGAKCPGTICQPASGSAFDPGTSLVTCANPFSTCQFTVTVKDMEPPRLTCPADITVPGTSGAGVSVTYPAPAASDNCMGVTSSCAPPSGSVFPVGTTSVLCGAQDAAGQSSSCQFAVTVERADLAISNTTTITKVSPGQNITYTIQVVNNGPGPAHDIIVNDSVPANCTFVSATGTGLYAPPVGSVGTASWSLGPMASGATAKMTVTMKVSTKGKGSVTNTASVSSPSFDPNGANNSATATTRIPTQGK